MRKPILGAALALLLGGLQAQAQTQRLCVFDILGAQGDAYNMMKDYQLVAKQWGANIELRPYTDERIASEDFKAGQCDAVTLSGLRGRQFNPFTGTIDSVGSVPTYDHMRKVIETLSNPKAAKLMVNGTYEVAAIIPLGAAYVFVNDRAINTLAKASGKKIAVLEWDKSQAKLVQRVGAQPVSSDITNFAGKFNNGVVDIIAAPAVAFRPLELWKGLGTKGGIANMPMLMITGNLIIRPDKFPAGFGQKSREYAATNMEKAFQMISREEAAIDKKFWFDVPAADKAVYVRMMRESRILLRQDGFYDPRMLKLLKKIRCDMEPANEECSQGDE